jgi:hypothetical protein
LERRIHRRASKTLANQLKPKLLLRSVSMNKKFLVALSAAMLSAFAGESYRITLFQPSVVNGTTLKPGDYKVEVSGGKATIKAGKNTVEADVRLETADQKFSSTSVRYASGDGQYKVQEIRVGGTNTRIVFGEMSARPAGE